MNLSQSAVSRQIILLEEELGFQLFDRSNRAIRITEAAKVLLPEVIRLRQEFETARRKAKLVSTGEIGKIKLGHIGSIAYSWLPGLLATFTREFPSVQFDILEISGFEAEKRLLTHQLDIGFWRDPSQSTELDCLAVYTEPFALVIPESYPIQQDTFRPLATLQDENFIMPDLDSEGYYSKELKKLFAEHKLQPKHTITSDFGATILQLVATGMGLSIMPYSYSGSPIKGVRFIKLVQQSVVYMIWRKNDPSVVLKNFRERAVTIG